MNHVRAAKMARRDQIKAERKDRRRRRREQIRCFFTRPFGHAYLYRKDGSRECVGCPKADRAVSSAERIPSR